MKNYYEILQVTYDASQAEIKEAYHKHLLKSIPTNDFIDFDQQENNFEDIQESYEVLSDKRKRMAYDQRLSSKTSGLQDETTTRTPFTSVLEAMLQSRPKKRGRILNNLSVMVVLILFLIGTGLAVWYAYSSKTTLAGKSESETVMTTGTNHLSLNQPAVLESNVGEANRKDNRGESLRAYLALITDPARSYEEKNLAIQNALPLFEDANSRIVVIGLNDIPVRTQAVHEYLDFLLINAPQVVIKSLNQNQKGKITRLELSEHYDDGL